MERVTRARIFMMRCGVVPRVSPPERLDSPSVICFDGFWWRVTILNACEYYILMLLRRRHGSHLCSAASQRTAPMTFNTFFFFFNCVRAFSERVYNIAYTIQYLICFFVIYSKKLSQGALPSSLALSREFCYSQVAKIDKFGECLKLKVLFFVFVLVIRIYKSISQDRFSWWWWVEKGARCESWPFPLAGHIHTIYKEHMFREHVTWCCTLGSRAREQARDN